MIVVNTLNTRLLCKISILFCSHGLKIINMKIISIMDKFNKWSQAYEIQCIKAKSLKLLFVDEFLSINYL